MDNQINDEANQFRPLQRRTKKPLSAFTIFLAIALTAFVGFILGTRADSIYAEIGSTFGLKTTSQALDMSQVQDVYRKLEANFDGKLDKKKLIEGAKTGLVAAAGDPHTSYMDPEVASEFQDSLNGQVSGVGAEIGLREGEPTILRVLDKSPAKDSGLQSKDVIIRVNDTITKGLSPSDVADMIRGEIGTTVKIFVVRDSEQKEFTVTRKQVSDPSVESRIENGVGNLHVRRFDDQTVDLARRAAESYVAANVKGVVLDLRDNGGGYLEGAKQLAGLWLTNKQVVATETRGGKEIDRLYAQGEPILSGKKTIILTNGGSASASEVLAGALQYHKVAQIYGEKSFGKGTIQQVINMPGGGELKVTIARWNLPNGKNIDKKGINPDAKVELTLEDMDAYKDPQLEAALRAL